MNLPFDLGCPLAGTLRERLRSAHKVQALSEVETQQRGNLGIFFSKNLLSRLSTCADCHKAMDDEPDSACDRSTTNRQSPSSDRS